MSGAYDDIIDLPHHVSSTRAQMSMQDRAAQFSPFAALTGYDAAVKETARLTESKIEADEEALCSLNTKLQLLNSRLAEQPEVVITYFKPDGKKAGGAYVTAIGRVKRLDEQEGIIVMLDGAKIPMCNVLDLDGRIFAPLI